MVKLIISKLKILYIHFSFQNLDKISVSLFNVSYQQPDFYKTILLSIVLLSCLLLSIKYKPFSYLFLCCSSLLTSVFFFILKYFNLLNSFIYYPSILIHRLFLFYLSISSIIFFYIRFSFWYPFLIFQYHLFPFFFFLYFSISVPFVSLYLMFLFVLPYYLFCFCFFSFLRCHLSFLSSVAFICLLRSYITFSFRSQPSYSILKKVEETDTGGEALLVV